MPRFSLSRTFAVASLRAFLRLQVGVGRTTLPVGEAEGLADGLRKARRTSQKRARRIRALKAELAELRTARSEDARLLDYLLSDAFERRAPWVTGIQMNGKTYGRAARHASPRLGEFFRAFPEASRGRVLEPGSLEGAMTVELAKRAREVVGLEARPESVERAEFLKDLFSAQNATFHLTNLEENDLSSYGAFDAVFCCGLLYHLPNPRAFVERLAAVSPNLYLTPSTRGPNGTLPGGKGCGAGSAGRTPRTPGWGSRARPSGRPSTSC